ncbi:MAG: sugar phosphate nucleotidyltransferase [Anaerolineales bacterium]
MRIVIPTAGFGTRLRPHTWSKPKPLVAVAGKPVLGHVLDMFGTLTDIDEVVFIIGYLGEQIEAYVTDVYPQLNSRFVAQQEMLGQSHAIWLAREGLEGPMLMAFVDTLIDVDLSGLSSESAQAVAWVKEVEDPRRFGVADVNDDGRVERLVEKPKDTSNNLAVVGFYYFEEAKRLISAIEKQMESGDQLQGEWFLADAINLMLRDGLQMRVEMVEEWHDCGKPGPLLETNRYLLDNGRDNSEQAGRAGSIVVPPVFIHPSAEVINAVVGPHVSVGAECKIERATIRDSILEDGASVEQSNLTGSVIGRRAQISGVDGVLNIGDDSVVGVS